MTSVEQPANLIYSGQTGNYFGTEDESLPTNVDRDVREVGQMLISQSLNYLGKLTCSQFSNIEIYSYGTTDKQIAVSIMADSSGLAGIDCVSRFADDSFLTTTTTKILNGAYDEQKLFRVSFPGLSSTELLAQHIDATQYFAEQHGVVESIFADLLSIAKLVDEYTVRQQSTPGHGFLQLASGFARSKVAGMMGDDHNDDEDDDWDEADYDRDKIEYDLETISPLTLAILQDDLEGVKTFIRDGVAVNPDGKNWNEEVPLVAAVYRGNSEMIQTLIAAGAEMDRLDLNVDSRPLGMAIKQDRLDLVELLLNAGADPNILGEEEFDEGMTALMYIASSFWATNRAEVIKFLVDRGANPNIQDERGRTALMIAGDLTDSVKALIDVGADLNLRDKEGKTALMKATWAVQQLLRKAGASEEEMDNVALVNAVFEGDLAQVKALIQAGANINYDDGSALETAASRGNLAIAEYLIEAGADVNLGWKTGLTAIASAAYEGYLDIVERLLEAEANPFQRCHDDEFYDALDYARQGQLEGQRARKGREHQAIIDLLSQGKS